ncbi:hypothetical protein Hanom_Chr16g01479311 [Helianthus anomalus]
MLRISNRISDHIFQKDLQHSTRFLVDQPADTLHSTSSRQTPDRRLRDSLNVVTENFTVSFSSSFPQSLSSLSTSRHSQNSSNHLLQEIDSC